MFKLAYLIYTLLSNIREKMKIQFNFRNCNSTGKIAGSKKKYYNSDKKYCSSQAGT